MTRNIPYLRRVLKDCRRYIFRYGWLAIIIAVFVLTLILAFNKSTQQSKPIKPKIETKAAIYKPTTTSTTTTTTTTVPPTTTTTRPIAPPAQPITGDKYEWLAQSKIAPELWVYVDYIISHESGWLPHNVNPGGCIGLGQNCPWNGVYFLPLACPNWQTDPVCQLNRWDEYATKYGGWKGSYNYWLANENW